MNRKHHRTLNRIFETPTPSNLDWKEAESLPKACGAEIRQGRGSRLRVVKGERVLNLHSPHPQKEIKRYAVELVRDFLTEIGETPE